MLAAAGAAALNEWAEGAFLLFLFSLGHAGEPTHSTVRARWPGIASELSCLGFGSFEILLSDLESGIGFRTVAEELAGWEPAPLAATDL